MPESMTTATDERAAALLRVAAYLSRPQKFLAVGEARAELRRTLELAEEGSVVLTTHGEPEAAVVSFATLEDMRRALMQLLVSEMEASFARAQEGAREDGRKAEATDEEELGSLIGEGSARPDVMLDFCRSGKRPRGERRERAGSRGGGRVARGRRRADRARDVPGAQGRPRVGVAEAATAQAHCLGIISLALVSE
jgi:PHD/YefM family antitoxin component YafN of YafNO toxin-antitoxin module